MAKQQRVVPKLARDLPGTIEAESRRFKGLMAEHHHYTFAEILAMFTHGLISKHEVRAMVWRSDVELYLQEVLALVSYRIVKKREARDIVWGT